MKLLKSSLSLLLTLSVLLGLPSMCCSADDWLPVNPADLEAKDSPEKPGAHAIYLYREDIRDDTRNHEDFYERIKIFTEEGKKYADVELTYVPGIYSVGNVRARTIHPDGSIVEWSGELLDKTIVKAQDSRSRRRHSLSPKSMRAALSNINTHCR